MADITKAFTAKYGISLSDIVGVFTSSSDPTTGEVAPKGSILLRQPGGSPLGEVYLKRDTGNTDWVKLFDRKCLFSATTAPTNSDDSTQGYSSGSVWVDTTNDKAYICLDATTSSAIWHQIDSTGGSGAYNTAYSIGFTNSNLSSGILSVTHDLGTTQCTYNILDNNNKALIPDDITFTSTTATVDLTSFGTITGTWSITILGNGGLPDNLDKITVTGNVTNPSQRTIRYTGTGGHTVTLPTPTDTGTKKTFIHAGTGVWIVDGEEIYPGEAFTFQDNGVWEII